MSGVLLNDQTATIIYYPHIASDATWWTGLVAYNPAAASNFLIITPYKAAGEALAPQSILIGPRGKYVGVVADLNLPAETAWLQIQGTGGITGFELFATNDGKQMAGYTGVGISGKERIFAKIEKSSGWTGIAFVNLDVRTAAVILTAYDDSGAAVAAKTMTLGAHEKVVGLAENLFSQSIAGATYIGYSSDRVLVGFQLNGYDGGMMLDGLPGLASAGGAPACSFAATAWQPMGIAPHARPTISATFKSQCGAEIDISSLEMYLDYEKVTPTVSGSGSEVTITYEPPADLVDWEQDATHSVRVLVQDVYGTEGEKSWDFVVLPAY